MSEFRIIEGDCLTRLAERPAESVQTCVTSPPYWGLRDYQADGQLGLEPTPEEYVANMVEVFRGVKRVLRDDGTLWLNLGDSYISNPGQAGRCGPNAQVGATRAGVQTTVTQAPGCKPKDLCGIPWLVAFALRADGWYLRSDIIWAKPNPMPESVTDRPTKAHEYLFLLTKQPRYFYDADAVREPHTSADDARNRDDYDPARLQADASIINGGARRTTSGPSTWPEGGRNRRSVWTVTTQPFSWKQNARRVRVELDEADDDTKRSRSPSCPLHGDSAALASNAPDGEHEADDLSRNGHSDVRHDQAQLDEPAPIGLPLGLDSAGGSSDSPRPADSRTATPRNKGTRKTASGSVSGGTASGETTPRIEDMSQSSESPAPGGSGSPDSSETPDRIAHKSACTCKYYRLDETDHFATFPPKLIEPCILAGSPPKCCGECGAAWERVVERTGVVLKEPAVPISERRGDAVNDKRTALSGTQVSPATSKTLGWRSTCNHDDDSGTPTVLDPFSGAGTTGVVALRHDRNYIGIELNPEYAAMSRERIREDAPLLNLEAA